jgi:hypothetical protein
VSWRASQPQTRWDRLRRAGVALLIVALAGLTSLVPAAAQHPNGTGLVIRHGDGTLVEIYVQFDEASLTGEELLNRSGLDFSEAPFGGLGAGVCSIGGEGCPSDNCYCKSYTTPAYYWRYYALQDGGWLEQLRGPSTHVLHDGDVDAWSWTAGDPGLPNLTIDDIAAVNGVDRNAPDPTATATATIIPPTATAPPPEPTATDVIVPTATATSIPTVAIQPTATAAALPTATSTSPAIAAVAPTATRAVATATRPPTATSLSRTATRTAPTAVATTLGVVIAPSGTPVALQPSAQTDSGSDTSSYVIFGAMAAVVIAAGAFALVRARRSGVS